LIAKVPRTRRWRLSNKGWAFLSAAVASKDAKFSGAACASQRVTSRKDQENLQTKICADPEGFDRQRFHDEFNRSVIQFFSARLQGSSPHWRKRSIPDVIPSAGPDGISWDRGRTSSSKRTGTRTPERPEP
jgi:hypothetical protein